MRKLLPAITGIFFYLVFFHLLAPVRADYQKAYADYVYNYSLYRNAVNDFQVAKSSYLTYRTLTAQNEALNKFRAVLVNRDQMMAVYYNLLQEKLNSTNGVDDPAKDTLNGIKASEQSWLTSHSQKIQAAASIEDLNSVSAEFDNRFPQMDQETKQTVGNILLAKESNLKSQADSLSSSLSDRLTYFRGQGQDTAVWDRGVLSAKSKLEVYLGKYNSAHDIFFPQNFYSPNGIDLFRGQQALTEANQYLRETVSFLLEVVKSITG